ncbi:restriction endonuclease subunit S [Polaromonas sp.]|uniref:restriction endonuclease subunit S n=1 Tax=Polaromonas sp. TaxID=1869339 RepID=UPI0037523F7C
MLLSNLNLLATAPGGVARLRELILTLAVQGKLVAQDPKDEPASELLKKIRAEKDRLIAERTLKREKDEPALTDDALPFALPDSWSWAALGEVIDIVRGITFPATQKTREAAPGRIACLRTSNVQQTIEWEDLLFVDRSFMGREDQLIQHHDIVMSMANSRELVGKVALIDQIPHAEATFGGFLGVLRPRKIDPRYAMAVLRTPYARSLLIDSSSQTTNIANVSLAKLRPLPFPLPPEAEQSRIVTRVEDLMRLCDALEAKGQLEATQHAQVISTLLATLTDSETPAQLANNWHRVATHFDLLLDRPQAVDALEQTILQLAVRGLLVPQDPQDEPASELLKKIRAEKDKLIAVGKIKRDKPLPPIEDEEQPYPLPQGWEWTQTGHLVNDSEAGWSPTCIGSPRRSGHWGVLKVSAVSWGAFDANANKELPADLVPRPEYEVQDGDFLLSRANTEELVARSVVVGKAVPLLMLSDKIIRLDVSSLMHRDFLNLCNNAHHARAHYIANASGTSSSMKNVSREVVLRTPVPLPPLAEQSRIVTRVAQLRRLCADLRQRLTASQSSQAHLAEALVQEVA